MIHINNIKRIEAYLENRMPEEEMRVFEQELQSSSELSDMLEKYKIAVKSVDLLSEEKWKEKFSEWRQSANRSSSGKPKIISISQWKYMRIAMAALVIVLLGVSLYLFFNRTTQEEKLIAFYYEPAKTEFTKGKEDDTDLENAFASYNQGDFQNAINILENIQPSSDRIKFYLGHCYFQIKDYHSARNSFRLVAEQKNSIYREEAEWNLALSCLLTDQRMQFENNIQAIIADSNHSYHKQAIELVSTLKK